ncbi:MAG: porin family protein [Bacteroidota bacterium]
MNVSKVVFFRFQAALVILILCTLSAGYGQNICTQTLRTARNTYEQGRLHELPDILASCLRNGFTTEEKVEAYKLLTLAYIYLDEPDKADESMLSLLRTNPEFAINEAVDPAEFINLYRTFRTNPIFSVGGVIGPNLTGVNLTEANSTNDLNGNAGNLPGSYDLNVAAHIGLAFDFTLTDKLSFAPELHYSIQSFKFSNDAITTIINTDGTVIPFTNNQLTEIQNRVELPLMLRYTILNNRFKPYVSFGFSVNYLINANIRAERFVLDNQDIRERTIDVTDLRENLTFSALVGAGIKMKFNRGLILAGVTYAYGINDVTASENAFVDPELVFNYRYVDSVFSTNSLRLSIGYVAHIYNPKKRR